MIKVRINKNKLVMPGHAEYAEEDDIVCAAVSRAVSSIVTTSINACLKIEANSLIHKEIYEGKELSKLTI